MYPASKEDPSDTQLDAIPRLSLERQRHTYPTVVMHDSQSKSKSINDDNANSPDMILYSPPSPIALWMGIAI